MKGKRLSNKIFLWNDLFIVSLIYGRRLDLCDGGFHQS